MVQNLSNIYHANFKKIRGKAAEGYVRPTLSEFFMSQKDFTYNFYITKPINISPANNAVDQDLELTLTCSDFDSTGTHQSTDWEVYIGEALEYSSYSDALNKTSITVDLAETTQYTWRVRHNASNLGSSEWSTITSFTTKESSGGDVGGTPF